VTYDAPKISSSTTWYPIPKNLCTYSLRDLLLLFVTYKIFLPIALSLSIAAGAPDMTVSPVHSTPSQSHSTTSTDSNTFFVFCKSSILHFCLAISPRRPTLVFTDVTLPFLPTPYRPYSRLDNDVTNYVATRFSMVIL